MTPEIEDKTKKRYQEVPGDWINEQMRRSREEFVVFTKSRAAYNSEKSRYNGSLRLQSTNWFTDLFNMKPGEVFSLGDLNEIFPGDQKIGANAFDRPVFPFAIYNQTKYFGPNLDDIDIEEIVAGYGKPMSTMYDLEEGDQA